MKGMLGMVGEESMSGSRQDAGGLSRPPLAAGLSEVLSRNLDRAYYLALRVLGDREGALDAAQEACARFIARPPEKGEAEAAAAYFLRTVYRLAVNTLHRERARGAHEEEYAVATEDGPVGPEDAAVTAETAQAARAEIDKLPEETRAAVCLCCEQGFTQQEAAEILEVPVGTVAKRVQRGLSRLRERLAVRGYAAAAPAALSAALGQLGLPGAPAQLVSALGKMMSGVSALPAGNAGAAASAAAKGGLAMKVIVSVVAAGVLASAVAIVNGVGAGFKPAPTTLASPPAAAPAEGKPAPINDYKGMQDREEKFEFAQKPAVKKEGEKWIITFATTANCDATVSILDKDGKVTRHLASGVLGKNAPHPFQQNSLAQKVEWDGQKDDFSRADAAGCKVRVSLGLKAQFERSMLWDPYFHQPFNPLPGHTAANEMATLKGNVIVAEGNDGTQYVISRSDTVVRGRAYDKDGKYLRTFFPPLAADVEKVMGGQGWKFATTMWGDKVVIGRDFGPFIGNGTAHLEYRAPIMAQLADPVAALKAQPGAGEAKIGPVPKLQPWTYRYEEKKGPNTIPHSQAEAFGAYSHRMAADRARDEIYFAGRRLDGKTGELDKTWPGVWGTECAVGPDGLYYAAMGNCGYGMWIARFTRDGKVAGFTGDGAVAQPGGNTWGPEKEVYGEDKAGKICGWWGKPAALSGDGKVLYTGVVSHSNTHERGMYVSPNGKLVMGLVFQGAPSQWSVKHGVPKEHKGNQQSFTAVWDKDGNYITANALGDTHNGHGVFMDRDGNIYATVFGTLKKSDSPDGIKDSGLGGGWGGFGGLVKFRWEGKFPMAELDPQAGKGVESQKNALWTYNGIPSQTCGSCTCFNIRCDMDYWARTWVPANQLCSVVVIDSNGNRVARIGRYGNVDDADPKCGKVHFARMSALCVSDNALYVCDRANMRILKAALSYAAEETVPAP